VTNPELSLAQPQNFNFDSMYPAIPHVSAYFRYGHLRKRLPVPVIRLPIFFLY